MATPADTGELPHLRMRNGSAKHRPRRRAVRQRYRRTHPPGRRHCPSGVFLANAAWALIVTLAHNPLRWIAAIGLGIRGQVVAKTVRRRLLALPGRLTRSARRRLLHLPAGWPWAQAFTQALARLRALPC